IPLFCGTARRPPAPTPFPYTTLFRSATATDHSAPDARTAFLDGDEAQRLFQRVRSGTGSHDDARLLSQQLLGEMARMSSEDGMRSEEHTSELQSRENLVCRLLLEKKK